MEIDMLIDGAAAPVEILSALKEVVVDDSIDSPSMFLISVAAGDDPKTPWSFQRWVDRDLFWLGNKVEIRIRDVASLTSLITGEITALEPEFVSDQLPVMKLRGYDLRHRLQRGRRTRTFLEARDSDIATQIGVEAGLSVRATDTGIILQYLMQANQTDWEFLCQRGRLIGYEMLVRDGALFFQPVGNDQSDIVLDWDVLTEFHPRLSSSGLATEVKVQGWSVTDKKSVLGESRVGDEASKMGGKSSGAAIVQAVFGDAVEIVSDQPVRVQAEADQIAKARFNELTLALITGEGACAGNARLRAGKVIQIDGVGQRFSGRYYVTSAIYKYSPPNGYSPQFVVRRNAS